MTVPEGADWLLTSPVSSQPAQLDRVAAMLTEKQGDVWGHYDVLLETINDYYTVHEGPYIDVIYREGSKVCSGLLSLVSDYDNVAFAFTRCASGLRDLEDMLSNYGGLISLRNDIVDGEDEDGTLLGKAKEKYDEAKEAERALLRTLSDAIEGASVGELADIDNAALNKVNDQLIEDITALDPDSTVVGDLAVAEMVIADEADGELDADSDAYRMLLDDGVSEDDVKK